MFCAACDAAIALARSQIRAPYRTKLDVTSRLLRGTKMPIDSARCPAIQQRPNSAPLSNCGKRALRDRASHKCCGGALHRQMLRPPLALISATLTIVPRIAPTRRTLTCKPSLGQSSCRAKRLSRPQSHSRSTTADSLASHCAYNPPGYGRITRVSGATAGSRSGRLPSSESSRGKSGA